jgi:hypothetical protein
MKISFALGVFISVAILSTATPIADIPFSSQSGDEDLHLINDPSLHKSSTPRVPTGLNPRFEGLTAAQVKSPLVKGNNGSPVNCIDYNIVPDYCIVPTSFDCREKWPSFIHPIRNMKQCGCDQAMAPSEVFSDRLAIATNGFTNEVLAPQELVSCDLHGHGCQGGLPQDAFQYMQNTGLPTEACYSYTSGETQQRGDCNPACDDGSNKIYYQLMRWQYVPGEAAMKAALQDGPVMVVFALHEDFRKYTSGIYKSNESTAIVGYKALRLVGYGEQDGTKVLFAFLGMVFDSDPFL